MLEQDVEYICGASDCDITLDDPLQEERKNISICCKVILSYKIIHYKKGIEFINLPIQSADKVLSRP